MKSANNKLAWYAASETRTWKRSVQVVESAIIALAGFVVAGAVLFYGDGSGLQAGFLVLTVLLAAASVCAVAMVRQKDFLSRWQVLALQIGLGCGVGLAAMAAFLILETQKSLT